VKESKRNGKIRLRNQGKENQGKDHHEIMGPWNNKPIFRGVPLVVFSFLNLFRLFPFLLSVELKERMRNMLGGVIVLGVSVGLLNIKKKTAHSSSKHSSSTLDWEKSDSIFPFNPKLR